MLGRVFMDCGDWHNAEVHLAASCAREPEIIATWMAMSELYSVTDRDDMAMRVRTMQRNTHPNISNYKLNAARDTHPKLRTSQLS